MVERGEERGLREREQREDIEKRDKRELSKHLKRRISNKQHRHLHLLISSRHCVSSEFPTRFCSKALQQ